MQPSTFGQQVKTACRIFVQSYTFYIMIHVNHLYFTHIFVYFVKVKMTYLILSVLKRADMASLRHLTDN